MDAKATKRLRHLRFSDLLIRLGDDRSIAHVEFREGRIVSPVPEVLSDEIAALSAMVVQRWQQENLEEFRMEHDGVPYRVSLAQTVEGSFVFLRRAFRFTGNLDDLGLESRLARSLRAIGNPGNVGLVLLAGRSGVGKTTLATTLFVEWLNRNGGIGVTVDDPVEHILSPYVTEGRVLQFEAQKIALPNGSFVIDFASPIVRTKRIAPNYTMIGEIRRTPEAQEAVAAGMAGTLTVSTIHGADISSSLMTLSRIAADGGLATANASIAEGLRAVLHMDMRSVDGKRTLQIAPLFVEGENEHAIRSIIRDGRFEMLGTYIDAARTQLQRQGA